MAKYMGCGGRGNESELHLAVMVLADALRLRIKVYTYDEHISPNNDELVTLWADYSGEGDCSKCPLVRLARLRNAFGILHPAESGTSSPTQNETEDAVTMAPVIR